MTLLAPIALSLIGILGLSLGALMVVAYLLKMRRRRFEVPFSTLWQRLLKERESTALWKQLRRLLSLLLLLFTLAILLFAATEPQLGDEARDAHHVVLIIDASASMKTRDAGDGGTHERIEVARERAADLLSHLGGNDRAMVVQMDGQATPLSRFTDDLPALKRVAKQVHATDTPADLRGALSLARDALRGRPHAEIILIGDGAYGKQALDSILFAPRKEPRLDDIDLSGIEVRFDPIGQQGENVGIIAFNVRRYVTNKLSYEVFIEVQNFGQKEEQRSLTIFSGSDPIDVRKLTLAPGQRIRTTYPNLGGGDGNILRAQLEVAGDGPFGKNDRFAVDDVAYALLPEQRHQKVLLVTRDNLYLEAAMLVYDNLKVEKLTPEEYPAALAKGDLPEYDAVVFDGFAPEAMPPGRAHALYFDPSGPYAPFPAASKLSRPRVTSVQEEHPVTRWLVLSDVNIDSSSVFDVKPEAQQVALALSIRAPIIAAKRENGRKSVAVGFGLSGTDLMLRAAFPLFLVNTLEWFAGDETDLITTYSTGRRIEMPVDSTLGVLRARLQTPGGRLIPVPLADDRAAFYSNEIGIHQLLLDGKGEVKGRLELATNLANALESNVTPVRSLAVGGKTLQAPVAGGISVRRDLWVYLLLLAALLLAVEWATYHRRVTV